MTFSKVDRALKTTLFGLVISVLSIYGCVEVTKSHPDQWLLLSVLGSIAIAMELISLESAKAGVRFTFSLPYIAAITVAIGARQGLFIEVLMVTIGTLCAFWFQGSFRLWTLVWNRALGFTSFLAGLLAYHWLKLHFGETLLAPAEVVVFMLAYVTVDLLGMAFVQGLPALSTLAITVGDSTWLAASLIGFYILIGVFAASLVYEGSFWLLPITAIPALALRAGISYRVKMVQTYDDTITALALMLQRAHPFTHDHVDRVADTAERVARVLGLSRKQAKLVRTAAVLHDIGKIAVDEKILDKPSKLTDDEYKHVQQHAEIGAQILEPVRELNEISEWVRYHHERPDGRGYPAGLTSVEIPLESKIIAVVDAFDAMTGSDDPNGVRPYRKPMSSEEALRELKRCAGTQFDTIVVEAFCKAYKETRPELEDRTSLQMEDAFA